MLKKRKKKIDDVECWWPCAMNFEMSSIQFYSSELFTNKTARPKAIWPAYNHTQKNIISKLGIRKYWTTSKSLQVQHFTFSKRYWFTTLCIKWSPSSQHLQMKGKVVRVERHTLSDHTNCGKSLNEEKDL